MAGVLLHVKVQSYEPHGRINASIYCFRPIYALFWQIPPPDKQNQVAIVKGIIRRMIVSLFLSLPIMVIVNLIPRFSGYPRRISTIIALFCTLRILNIHPIKVTLTEQGACITYGRNGYCLYPADIPLHAFSILTFQMNYTVEYPLYRQIFV